MLSQRWTVNAAIGGNAHYLHRDIELARTAITKLEMGYAKKGAA